MENVINVNKIKYIYNNNKYVYKIIIIYNIVYIIMINNNVNNVK